jgi:hypothetical protein
MMADALGLNASSADAGPADAPMLEPPGYRTPVTPSSPYSGSSSTVRPSGLPVRRDAPAPGAISSVAGQRPAMSSPAGHKTETPGMSAVDTLRSLRERLARPLG